jgi:hypothetical protein
MQIKYVRNFNQFGCHWKGDLAYVDTTAEAEAIASRQPLNGFGRGAHLDASSDGMGLLKSEHQDRFTVLLGIPYPVVRLHSHEEWLRARSNYEGN